MAPNSDQPTPTQRLVIRVSRHSLSFSTIGAEQSVVYEQYPVKSSISMAANLREALRSVPLLQQSYQRATLMVDSPVLMTPIDLFDEAHAELCYRHAVSLKDMQMVAHYVLPDLNAVALFAVHKDLRQVVAERFPTVTVIPAVAPVWRHQHQRSFTGLRPKLYAYFHDQKMEVFAFQQNRFKFCNAFAVGNDVQDALFYLLSAWKQLGMNPREDELHLCGSLPTGPQPTAPAKDGTASDGSLTTEARRFVKRVYVSNPSGEFNRAAVTQIAGMPYDLMLYYLKGR